MNKSTLIHAAGWLFVLIVAFATSYREPTSVTAWRHNPDSSDEYYLWVKFEDKTVCIPMHGKEVDHIFMKLSDMSIQHIEVERRVR